MNSKLRTQKSTSDLAPVAPAAVDPTTNGQAPESIDPATNGQGPVDIPGFEDLPPDVRTRLAKARRDPTQAEPLAVVKKAQAIRVGAPGANDIFRTYPDATGWFDVNLVTIKKGFDQNTRKKVFLVGEVALANPAVAQRARAAVAILTVTTEGLPAVWVIPKPSLITAPDSYPYDQPRWECAEAARVRWVTFAWNKERGLHEWSVINLDGLPGSQPTWPAEHPLVLIDRAIAGVFVDDPDFPEFQNLLVRSPRT
jgi:hypothetical protein